MKHRAHKKKKDVLITTKKSLKEKEKKEREVAENSRKQDLADEEKIR